MSNVIYKKVSELADLGSTELNSNVKFLAINSNSGGTYMNFKVSYGDMSSDVCNTAYSQMSDYVNTVSASLSDTAKTIISEYSGYVKEINSKIRTFTNEKDGFLSVKTAEALSSSISSTISSQLTALSHDISNTISSQLTALSGGISDSADSQLNDLSDKYKDLSSGLYDVSSIVSSDLSVIATNSKPGLVKVGYDNAVSSMYFPVRTLADGTHDGYAFAYITSADLDDKLCGYAGISYTDVVSYVNDVSSKLGSNAKVFDSLSDDVKVLSGMAWCIANETQTSSDSIAVKKYVLLKQTLTSDTEPTATTKYFIGYQSKDDSTTLLYLSSIMPKLAKSVVPNEGIYTLIGSDAEAASQEYDVISCQREGDYYSTFICVPSAEYNGIGDNAASEYVLNTVTASELISAENNNTNISTTYAGWQTTSSVRDQMSELSNSLNNLNTALLENFGKSIGDLTGSYVLQSQVTKTITDSNKIVTQDDIKALTNVMHFTYAVSKEDGESDAMAIKRTYDADSKTPATGDVVIVTDSSKEYVYDGKSWCELGDESAAASSAALETEQTARKAADTFLSNEVTALTSDVSQLKTDASKYSTTYATKNELTAAQAEVASSNKLGRIMTNYDFSSDKTKHAVMMDGNYAYVSIDMSEYVLQSQVTSLTAQVNSLTSQITSLIDRIDKLEEQLAAS